MLDRAPRDLGESAAREQRIAAARNELEARLQQLAAGLVPRREFAQVFLRLRFGEHYWWLAEDGLEEGRLAFYELALYLSLVAGPLRLLDGDYPDRAQMLAIAEHSIGHALACLQ